MPDVFGGFGPIILGALLGVAVYLVLTGKLYRWIARTGYRTGRRIRGEVERDDR